MKRRTKRARAGGGAAKAHHRQASESYRQRSRFKHIVRDFFKGAFFIIVVLAIKLGVEHTSFGAHLEQLGYETLQHQLSPDEMPVQIIDISDLEPEPFNVDGKTGVATPREPLQKMIDTMDKLERKPLAVGIDIDFAPGKDGYIHPRDPQFFQHCLGLGVPVFLGIKRTHALPPELWLGSEEFEKLAASILIPNRDTRKMPEIIQTSEEFKPGRTMGGALADTFQRSRNKIMNLLVRAGLVELKSEEKFRQGGRHEDFLVDYSPLETLMKQRLINFDPRDLRQNSRMLARKIVLAGDATVDKATDLVDVPGRPELGPVPGVYLHACAAYTLARAPLYELRWQGRIIIDLLLSGGIFLAIMLIRLYYLNKTLKEVAAHRLQGLFTLLVIIGALVIGVTFVQTTRLMWDDFILVFAALVFHPSIERRLEGVWKGAPKIFHGLIFEREPGNHR